MTNLDSDIEVTGYYHSVCGCPIEYKKHVDSNKSGYGCEFCQRSVGSDEMIPKIRRINK